MRMRISRTPRSERGQGDLMWGAPPSEVGPGWHPQPRPHAGHARSTYFLTTYFYTDTENGQVTAPMLRAYWATGEAAPTSARSMEQATLKDWFERTYDRKATRRRRTLERAHQGRRRIEMLHAWMVSCDVPLDGHRVARPRARSFACQFYAGPDGSGRRSRRMPTARIEPGHLVSHGAPDFVAKILLWIYDYLAQADSAPRGWRIILMTLVRARWP